MPADEELLRGTVWDYKFAANLEPKPALIVSNNGRNRSTFPMVHVVRITTAPQDPRPSIVDLGDESPVHGFVLCDTLTLARKQDLGGTWGGLTPEQLRRVNDALLQVLDISIPNRGSMGP